MDRNSKELSQRIWHRSQRCGSRDKKSVRLHSRIVSGTWSSFLRHLSQTKHFVREDGCTSMFGYRTDPLCFLKSLFECLEHRSFARCSVRQRMEEWTEMNAWLSNFPSRSMNTAIPSQTMGVRIERSVCWRLYFPIRPVSLAECTASQSAQRCRVSENAENGWWTGDMHQQLSLPRVMRPGDLQDLSRKQSSLIIHSTDAGSQ